MGKVRYTSPRENRYRMEIIVKQEETKPGKASTNQGDDVFENEDTSEKKCYEGGDRDMGQGHFQSEESESLEPIAFASAEFRTFTSGSIWRATAGNLTALLKKQKKRKNKKPASDRDTVYLYDFGMGLNRDILDPPMHYQLFRTRSSAFLSFRALSRAHLPNLKGSPELLDPDKLRAATMLVSILDNQGRMIQCEKMSFCAEIGGKLYFEIEDFIATQELDAILEYNSSLILCIKFVVSKVFQTSVPKAEAPEALGSDFGSTERLGKSSDFKEFYVHDAFNSEFGTKIVNPKFLDGVLRVECKERSAVDIQVHRILVAAQSTWFEKKFSEGNQIVIEGFEVETVREFIDYVYCGELYISDLELLMSLYKFGDKFEVCSLKVKCARNIRAVIQREKKSNKQMAIEFYRLGVKLKASELTFLALDYYVKFRKSGKKNRKVKTMKLSSLTSAEDSYEDVRVMQAMEKLSYRECSKFSEESPIPACKTDGKRQLGEFMDRSAGNMFKIPNAVLEKMWKRTSEEEFGATEEKVFLEYDVEIVLGVDGISGHYSCSGSFVMFKLKGSDDIHLRFQESPDGWVWHAGADDEEEDDGESKREGSATPEPLLEHLRIPVIKVAICQSSGKIIKEARCMRTIIKPGSLQEVYSANVWESSPFIMAEDFCKFQELDNRDLVLRLSLNCGTGECKVKKETEKKPFAEEYMGKVVLDTYTARLHAQMKIPDFADAFIHIVDKEDKEISSFAVHKAVIGAFSPLLSTAFESTSDVYVPEEYFSSEAIQATLHYVYGMHIPTLNLGLGLQILNVCQDFKMGPRFKEHILESMLNLSDTELTFEFALIYYIYGKQVKVYYVRDYALNYFKAHEAELEKKSEYKSFIEAYPEIPGLLDDWKPNPYNLGLN